MKLRIDKLFLYRHRFYIGYTILGLTFIAILILLPLIAPGGISTDEMQSAVQSNDLSFANFQTGDLINLPYRLLQKLSISTIGLSLYAIKLPSIILGFAAGALLILLLNRWFHSNVALLASIITILSPIFLFLAGSGTPAILYIFWLTLILWLGAKIVGEKRQSPIIFISLIIASTLALYTPHLIYIAIIVVIAALTRPHIRFAIKKFSPPQLIIGASALTIFIAPLVISCIIRPSNLSEIFFSAHPGNYIDNVIGAFAPFFSFGTAIESTFLSPLFGLATIALIIIGVIASTKTLFTSRNTAISLLVLFAIFASGLNPSTATIIFIPATILVAIGLESILEKWYSLFPTNPYARIAGVIPIGIFITIVVTSGFIFFLFGYHYSPTVARQFDDDLTLIRDQLTPGAVLLVPENSLEYDFYKILEPQKAITVTSTPPDRTDIRLATLGKWPTPIDLPLSRIVTSPKSQNSDRLYIYNITD